MRLGSSFPDFPRRVHGVDFSGAADAGTKIWVATGEIVGEGDALRILECRRGKDLPHSGEGREQCLAALFDFIVGEGDAIIGLDFPFGLPHALVSEGDWEGFVRSFLKRCSDPMVFRRTCAQVAGGHELRRLTDDNSRTPWSPYNLRLFRQTYFGIRGVLGPLVCDKRACVLPMQRLVPDRPRIVEVCPASTLKRERVYEPYKGCRPKNREARREARQRILQKILGAHAISIPDAALQDTIVHDGGGDALDSVVAALATFRAVRTGYRIEAKPSPLYAIEGYIYV